MHRSLTRRLVILLLLAILSACGSKGPLVMPSEQPAEAEEPAKPEQPEQPAQ
jgi:predicted small lipoprotein YifL